MTFATFLLCATSVLIGSTAAESSTCTTDASGSCSATDVNYGSVDDAAMLQVVQAKSKDIISDLITDGYNSAFVAGINKKLQGLDSVIKIPGTSISGSKEGCIIPNTSGGCYCKGNVSYRVGLDECRGVNSAKLLPASINKSGSTLDIDQDLSMGPLTCTASITAGIAACGLSLEPKGSTTAGVASISIKGALTGSYEVKGLLSKVCFDIQLKTLKFGPISWSDISASLTGLGTYTIPASELDALWSELPVHEVSDTISKTLVQAINDKVADLGKKCFSPSR